MIYDKLMVNLPSENDKIFKNFLEDFDGRREYIKHFGFVPLTDELIQKVVQEVNHLKINSFLELGAGTGFLTKVLNDYNFKGVGLSLEIPSDTHHWGLSQSNMYRYCIEHDLLELGDMTEIKTTIPDLVISSWVPLNGGQEVIKFMENNGTPLWYLLIGEGDGGCTGSDEFHHYINDTFELQKTFDYKPFAYIYDRFELFRRKESND